MTARIMDGSENDHAVLGRKDLVHAYCTYFDRGYLTRGLALIASLRAHGDDSDVWVLALDTGVEEEFARLRLPGVHVVSVSALETSDPELLAVKAARSRMEYYFTCTPLLVRYVMNASPAGTAVAYLDADLWYFDDPGSVFDAMGDGSIGIIEHRYPPRLAARLAKYGRFNVGWVGFADDERGRACLDWWGARTLEWCSDTPEDGKYADQGYLDRFPELFEGVSILPSLGMDLAPWNTARFHITAHGDEVSVDGDRLVFFHFHGLRRVGRWWVTSQLVYGAGMGAVLRDRVYAPYARALERAAATTAPVPAPAARGTGVRGVLFRTQKTVLSAVSIVSGNAVRAGD